MEITEPTLLINEQIVRRNLQRMADKASQNGAILKPHVKTHQSITIGRWMRDYGIRRITVSSLKMAEYFARDGWDDITIAFPCNFLLGNRLNKLTQQIRLSILISDETAFGKIEKALTEHIHVYIEIDTGAGRTGLLPSQPKAIDSLTKKLNKSENLHFKGFYSHPGHSYQCKTVEEIEAVHRQVRTIMVRLKNRYSSSCPDLAICTGDTPCCSVATNFEGIDEMSPGNFAFYDLMQARIGACRETDIATVLACPVVAKYPQCHEVAIHAGAVHLSKESLSGDEHTHYGKVVSLNDAMEWSDVQEHTYLKSISQEHGIVACSSTFFKTIKTGDVIGILPVHSCLTADAMKTYKAIPKGKPVDHLEGPKNNSFAD